MQQVTALPPVTVEVRHGGRTLHATGHPYDHGPTWGHELVLNISTTPDDPYAPNAPIIGTERRDQSDPFADVESYVREWATTILTSRGPFIRPQWVRTRAGVDWAPYFRPEGPAEVTGRVGDGPAGKTCWVAQGTLHDGSTVRAQRLSLRGPTEAWLTRPGGIPTAWEVESLRVGRRVRVWGPHDGYGATGLVVTSLDVEYVDAPEEEEDWM